MSDMYEKIAARAYEIWEKEGRPDNKAEEHWLRAEREIADTREESRKRVSPPSVVVAAIPEGSVDTLGCCGAAKRGSSWFRVGEIGDLITARGLFS